MSYNLTQIANTSTMSGIIQNTNVLLMDGWLFTIICMSLTAVFLAGFYFSTRDIGSSATATSFIMFVLCVVLDALNLVPTLMTFIYLIAFAFSVAFLYKS